MTGSGLQVAVSWQEAQYSGQLYSWSTLVKQGSKVTLD